MNGPDSNLLANYAFKAFVVLIGFGCIALGVWLATRKLNTRVGNFEGRAGSKYLLKISRPTASALLIIAGAIIIGIILTRPFSVTRDGAPDDTMTATDSGTSKPDTTGRGGVTTQPGGQGTTTINDTSAARNTPVKPNRVRISDTSGTSNQEAQ